MDIIHISIKFVLSMPTLPAPVSTSIDAEQRKRRARDGENAFIVVALTHPERGMDDKGSGFLKGTLDISAIFKVQEINYTVTAGIFAKLLFSVNGPVPSITAVCGLN